MRLLLTLGFVLVLVASAVGVGLGEAEAGQALNTTQVELDDNRALWESQGIDDYSLITQAFCFCILEGPVTVEVVDGEVVSVDPADTPEFFQYTVEGLFEEIQQALDQNAVVLQVTYDENGIPLSINIDVDFTIADEELSIEVLGVTPGLGPDPGPTGVVLTLVVGGQFVFWSYADSTSSAVFGTLKIAWLFNAGSVMWTSFVPDLGVTDFALTDGAVLWLVMFEATEIPLDGSVSSPTTGPGISVTEALESTLNLPLLVNGFIVVSDGVVRLCEALAESFPPQCGGDRLTVEGLDLSMLDLETVMSVQWTDQQVQVLGTVADGVLTVA